MGIATILRLYRLEAESLWGDEIAQALVAQKDGWWQTVLAVAGHRGAIPLDYLATHFALYAGQSEAVLRLPAVVFGIMAVLALYWLGRRLFDEVSGLAAAATLAVAPLHVYYSQEARYYSLATLMMLLTTLAFVRASDRQSWALFALTATLALYTHYYAVLLLFALGLWLLFGRRNALLPFMVAAGIAFLLFVPWIYWDIVRACALNPQVDQFILPSAGQFISGLFVTAEGARDCYWLCRTGALVSAALPVVGVSLALKHQRQNGMALLFPLFVGAVGIAGAMALNYIGSYFFAYRQLLPFAPFILLFVVSVTLSFVSRVDERLILPTATLLVLMASIVAYPHLKEM